jgi:Zn-dependent metalloprotease
MRLYLYLLGLIAFGPSFLSAQSPSPKTFENPTSHRTTRDWFTQKGASVYFHFNQAPASELRTNGLTSANFFSRFAPELHTGPDDTFVSQRTETDALGQTHTLFHQYYRQISVHGGGIMLHTRQGRLEKANGRFYAGIQLDVRPSISEEIAIIKAFAAVSGTAKKTAEDIALVITCIDPNPKTEHYRLAYRIHVHSEDILQQSIVFIDAHSGAVLRRVPTVCTGDVTGTAHTLFSGQRSITTDQFAGGYRLQQSGRPIQTKNIHHTQNLNAAIDIIDADNVWQEQIKVLRSLTLNVMNLPWWQSPGQTKPSIYLLFKDGGNNTVAQTIPLADSFPPFTIPIQLPLYNPPYTISFFDGNGTDFGGTINVNTNPGTWNFSAFGNSGNYKVVQENNPALDAHWCMEQTYDYYLNEHNRNSYDNAGALIQSYVHFGFGWPNGAWTLDRLFLGDGDGVNTTYRTYLNVVSHEFTHGVINNNGGGGLDYLGESGALNESFADIFGTAVEHYAKPDSANWLHGEEGSLIPGGYVRSMENPRAKQQPDTYGFNDSYWVNPADTTFDFGGVHVNSGVQNHWFYLLSEGGSGVNENGDAYDVTGIGIKKAEDIAYRNLTTYITASSSSNYEDAREGSLMAAEDLYGAGSPEYLAVDNAWYAVGIGDNPIPTCAGNTDLSDVSGTVTDGSGSSNYSNNTDCTWRINPNGANTVTLTFTAFDLEDGKDFLTVYDGGDINAPVLLQATGNALPASVTSSDGILFIRFTSDASGSAQGWSADYTSAAMTYCQPLTTLTDPSGDLEDGSGVERYGNNSDCYWLIEPTDAATITLAFSELETEEGYDLVTVYDGPTIGSAVLGTYSGNTIPMAITSSGGSMLVRFLSDYLVRFDGWEASYTSTAVAPWCAGAQVLTGGSGSFSDGSGMNNYTNNTDCTWLISPPGANTITLDFTEMDLEVGNDMVTVYDGADENAPLLLSASGNMLPAQVSSSDGVIFVHFTSDGAGVSQGWAATYTSSAQPFCQGTTTLTNGSGSIEDGSGNGRYGNNSDCFWLIEPQDAVSITLTFTAMATEEGADFVTIYDGATTGSPILGDYSGTDIPAPVTSSGGAILIHFESNALGRFDGWAADYTSAGPVPGCSGSQILNVGAGTISDGSGPNNYANNSDCSWLIAPPGANAITLDFTEMNLESGNDVLTVYDGADANAPVLLSASGNMLPAQVTSSDGVLFIHFTTNGSVVAQGWAVNYASSMVPSCLGTTTLTTGSGAFEDGSGTANYANNSDCYWLIEPTDAESITLTFMTMVTEDGFDVVTVYDGPTVGSPILGEYSGTAVPAPITSSGGALLVHFASSELGRFDGWAASYTSSEPAPGCMGSQVLSAGAGAISDGSGTNNYANNSDCTWLIEVPGSSTISLQFSAMALENGKDFVRVYDGADANSSLIYSGTGTTVPGPITSSDGVLFVHFESDASGTDGGWEAYYTADAVQYCSGTTSLTDPVGNLDDGSGTNKYGNGSLCQWLIEPENAESITFNFEELKTAVEDVIRVYDGSDGSAPLLGSYSGSTLPGAVTSSGGAMFIEFTTDGLGRDEGWKASYEAKIISSIADNTLDGAWRIVPNPSDGIFTLIADDAHTLPVLCEIFNALGEVVHSKLIPAGQQMVPVDMTGHSSGLYLLRMTADRQNAVMKLVKK